jgi:hypothetical protein
MADDTTRKCPFCGEDILLVAVKCKHCGSNLYQTTQNLGTPTTINVGTSTTEVPIKTTQGNSSLLGHGVSLVISAAILLLICIAELSDDKSSKDQLNTALGAIVFFGLWIIPHSVWLLGKIGSNKILPIVALAIFGMCGLSYVGSL